MQVRSDRDTCNETAPNTSQRSTNRCSTPDRPITGPSHPNRLFTQSSNRFRRSILQQDVHSPKWEIPARTRTKPTAKMTTTPTANQIVEVLEEACARNTPFELHFHSRGGGLTVAKSRVVKLGENTIYLDKPQAVGTSVDLQDNMPVEAHFALHRDRFFFKSTVTDPRARIELNEQNKFIGLAIAKPTRIKSGQRRNNFRVELAGLRTIDVHCHDAQPDKPDICPLNAKRFTGRLVDVSAGGMKLKVPRSVRDEFHASDRLFTIFDLPDESREEAVFLAKPVHWTTSTDREHTFIGLQFVAWPKVEFARNQRRMAQFVAKIERQLAKHRSAIER